MATRIDAVFEDGVFRPTGPVEIAEGERVQLVVLPPIDERDHPSAASILAEIAALPLEAESDMSTARDHDHDLDGRREV